jgi:hypothetical protein
MVKAAPQAARSKTPDEQALETLEATWGDFCLLGHDDEHGWWASRNGRTGSLLTSSDLGEMDAEITDDYGPGQ